MKSVYIFSVCFDIFSGNMNPLISFLSLSVYSPLFFSLSLSTHSFPLTLSIHICIPTPFLSLCFSLIYLLLFSLSLYLYTSSFSLSPSLISLPPAFLCLLILIQPKIRNAPRRAMHTKRMCLFLARHDALLHGQ